MRHVSLTCKNHPNLRWSCKEIAWTPGCGYNGSRYVFFLGALTSDGTSSEITEDNKIVRECSCHARDLRLAPEDPAYGNEQTLQQTVC